MVRVKERCAARTEGVYLALVGSRGMKWLPLAKRMVTLASE